MLTDADRLLVAAGVDGPLPPEQVAALSRLLAGSAEARALSERLAADRLRLAHLPRLTAPAGFADRVDAGLPIVRLSQPLPARRQAVWLPYATAAVVFLAISVGAYQLGGRRDRSGQGVASGSAPSTRPVSKLVPRPEQAPPPQPVPEPTAVANQGSEPRPEVAPTPRPVEPPALLAAGPFREIEPPATVVARLPLLGPVGDLDAADVRQWTADLWAGSPAARIDLFVPDVLAALPAVQAAAKGCGWTVSTDATAQAALKAKQPVRLALYADAVTAAEGGKFLAVLAAQGKGGTKLGVAHLSAAGPFDLRELKELFGGDPKPVSKDSTIGQVVTKLTPKRPALLFALAPPAARPAPGSKEVRAFAEGRAERTSGAIPLLVVVRPQD